MSHSEYDLICVGGGLAGAALAKAMAERGKHVLVLERETAFRDRVRGELMEPWGVAELRELGLYDAVVSGGAGKTIPVVDFGMGAPRNVPETTPQKLPFLGLCHPSMQEAILQAAAEAGAEVRRGAQVVGLEPGHPAKVHVAAGASRETFRASLVAGADGRDSQVRRWAGFASKEQKNSFFFSGVLLDGVSAPENTVFLVFNPEFGAVGALAPQPNSRVRAYLGYPTNSSLRFQGAQGVADFLAAAIRFVPPFSAFYAQAKQAGPLATFSCDENWVEHPYQKGVVLIGDAAATSDPMFGQGLSLAVRDVRVLRDCLSARDDWEAASNEYAGKMRQYFSACHKVVGWFRHIFAEQSDAAAHHRLKAFPLIGQDPMRIPDHLVSGPDLPHDDSVRARFYGEI